MIRWAAILALCVSAVAQTSSSSAVVAPEKRQVQAAEEAYIAGARMLERNDVSGAEIQFSRATKLNPVKQ